MRTLLPPASQAGGHRSQPAAGTAFECDARALLWPAGCPACQLAACSPWCPRYPTPPRPPPPLQLLAQEEASLQSILAQLNGLGLPEKEVADWICEYPSLLVKEVAAEQLPMLKRMYETRIGRYTQSGSYEV
jgi:hypothetical protein